VKVLDQIPISEDTQIVVKVFNPPELDPDCSGTMKAGSSSTTAAGSSVPSGKAAQIKVNGVVAQWDGADEPGVDQESLGKDGKFNWLCDLPAHRKVNLALQWEVSTPLKANVVGL
jgi:hypothetical protein